MDYFFYLLNVCKTQFESHEVNLESSGLLLLVLIRQLEEFLFIRFLMIHSLSFKNFEIIKKFCMIIHP